MIMANDNIIWKSNISTYRRTLPAVAKDKMLYIGDREGNVYALNKNGEKKWIYQTYSPVFSPALGKNNVIYVSCKNGKLYALNNDGSLKWEFDTGGIIVSSPAIGEDGTIYLGNTKDYFYAINADGTVKWKVDIGGILRSFPAISYNNTIYAGNRDGSLIALTPDGKQKWRFQTRMNIRSNPVIGPQGRIYIGDTGGNLYAINPDGSEKWEKYFDSSFNSSPVIGKNGIIYFANGVGWDTLYALDKDGNQLWEYNTQMQNMTTPALTDNNIIFGNDNILFFLCDNGQLDYKLKFDWPIESSPTISNNGTIYISTQTAFYAVKGDSTGPLNQGWPLLKQNNANTGSINNTVSSIGKVNLNDEDSYLNYLLANKVNILIELNSGSTIDGIIINYTPKNIFLKSKGEINLIKRNAISIIKIKN